MHFRQPAASPAASWATFQVQFPTWRGAVAAKDPVHYKIYPENGELRDCIKRGDNEYIFSTCSGKAVAVYPQVEDAHQDVDA